jgi:multimeric flavodoxin WrbA
MKVVAFNGSARREGNTHHLLKTVLAEIENEGIETELIWLGAKALLGCTACERCWETKNRQCVIKNDPMNEYIKKIDEADGVLIGSPVYCSDVSSNTRALIERVSFVGKANDDMYKRKVGAGVVAVRRCGASFSFSSINYFFLISQMIIPGSSYWNQGIGLEPGDVKNDEEGIRTMKNLGINMAWLIKKLQ